MKNLIKLCDDYVYLINYNQIINSELYHCFSAYGSDRKVVIEEVPIDKNNLKHKIKNLSKLIFEITQNCNLMCKYCTFGGHYYYERKVSNVSMNFEIARQGLDYIFDFIKDRPSNELGIGFYGGEPLIKFNLISEIVKYAKMKFKNWDLRFSVTTNCTYLNPDIIKFIKENNFSFCISLDGHREIHDKKRVFPNGEGSFELVWSNINKIATLEPEYYRTRVKFNTVLSKEFPLIEIFRFFTDNNLVNKNPITFNFIVNRKTDYFQKFPYNPEEFVGYLKDVVKSIEEKIVKGIELKPIENFMLSNKINEKALFVRNQTSLGGACLFGAKLFIDCMGKFHVCEQINNKYSYGDVYKGFDFDKIKQIIKSYLQINRDICSKCEVRFLCDRCYITFAGDGNFSFDKEYCRERKSNIIGKLIGLVKFNKRLMIRKNNIIDKSKRVKKFHQFVRLEKGPAKTAILDFLKGNIFQIENKIIDAFEKGKYSEINEFIEAAEKEELFLSVTSNTWIPESFKEKNLLTAVETLTQLYSLHLEVEEGADMDAIKEKFINVNVLLVIYFGASKSETLFPGSKIIYRKKDFNQCMVRCQKEVEFDDIDEYMYYFNMRYNSCWGKKVAITKDGKIRPCIYSEIIIGDLKRSHLRNIIEEAKVYWDITKDRINKCKDCELRYVCFDCREIAYRKNKNLYEANPYCFYDPYQGIWKGEMDD